MIIYMYSKTCVKQPLSKRPKYVFQDRFLLNAGQKYCKMLQREHFAILLTFIKLPVVMETFVLSILELPFYTDFTVPVCVFCYQYMLYFSLLTGGSLELVKEIFQEVKPGLSSYAEDPMQVK